MFVSFFQNINRNIKAKRYSLTVFEIALFGLLLAIYMISAVIQKYAFRGVLRISLTYAVVVVFGLALGPWKGAALGIIGNTLESVMNGISTWMLEYAIIPVIIAFMSGYLMNLLSKKQDQTWITGFVLLLVATAIFFSIIITQGNKLPVSESATSKKAKLIPLNIAIGISAFGIGTIWIFSVTLLVIYFKTRSIKIRYAVSLIFDILIILFFILVFTRWLWGPFAYITYRNRFRGANWKYSEWYFRFQIPIVFKSLIEIPIYSFAIYSLYPVIVLIRQKVVNDARKIGQY